MSEFEEGGATGGRWVESALGLQHFICVQSQPQQLLAFAGEAEAGANKIA